jgi:hypothetical protein
MATVTDKDSNDMTQTWAKAGLSELSQYRFKSWVIMATNVKMTRTTQYWNMEIQTICSNVSTMLAFEAPKMAYIEPGQSASWLSEQALGLSAGTFLHPVDWQHPVLG